MPIHSITPVNRSDISPAPRPRPKLVSTPSSVEEKQERVSKYDVGYGKTPIHTRFQPGQSGNPKGRPKGAKGMNTIITELRTEKVTIKTSMGLLRVSKMEAVIHKLAEKGFTGDVRAIIALIQLYAKSIPNDVPVSGFRTIDPAAPQSDKDGAALDALYQIVRDELQAIPQGDAS